MRLYAIAVGTNDEGEIEFAKAVIDGEWCYVATPHIHRASTGTRLQMEARLGNLRRKERFVKDLKGAEIVALTPAQIDQVQKENSERAWHRDLVDRKANVQIRIPENERDALIVSFKKNLNSADEAFCRVFETAGLTRHHDENGYVFFKFKIPDSEE